MMILEDNIMNTVSELGKLILLVREKRGLTQHQLSALTGFAQSAIASYEGGRNEPKLSTLNNLLAPLGLRVVATLEEIKEGGDGQ